MPLRRCGAKQIITFGADVQVYASETPHSGTDNVGEKKGLMCHTHITNEIIIIAQ